MTKKISFLFFLFFGFFAYGQEKSKEFRSKKIIVVRDSIRLDSVAINPYKFKIFDANNTLINLKNYQVDFSNSLLLINSKKYSEITVEYYIFPNFITKTYKIFDKSLIVPTTNSINKLYSLTTNKKVSEIKLFDGLKTKGFITRSITSGNNQNTVTNAKLDLEISGKLSKNIMLRANIYDTNMPLQENGYSQNITDFDRVFIEMYSKNWRIKAGDVSLKNNKSYFLNFEKQVSGVEVEAQLNKKTAITVSGAVVRGRFSSFKFTGIEGNQGPYKIFGNNREPIIVIVASSEKVFVNGVRLRRGEKEDYIIDYNLSEIRFNTSYSVTKDMRIVVEFQYSDRNYTRFVTYEKASYNSEKFSISGAFYSENDAKNSPLQQSLTNKQKQILALAGNNTQLMVSSSAFVDSFSENKILYKKNVIGNLEAYQYSTDKNETLYSVTFTEVGVNKGNYIIDNTIAIGTIYKYIGSNLGNYSPVIQLVAPKKTQISVFNLSYQPLKKTNIIVEVAFSNNDANLFSSLDNVNNNGMATRLSWQQVLIDKKWQLKSNIGYQFIHQNFKTIQRFQSVEFQRDWNLVNPTGNLRQISTSLELKKNENYLISYSFNQLKFSNFIGNKQEMSSNFKFKNTHFYVNGSFLDSNSALEKNNFTRVNAKIIHSFTGNWLGAVVGIESNKRINKINQKLFNTSHKFKEYESFYGVGDSTKVFAKLGINYRTNDSIKSNQFKQVNNRKTFYLQSRIIKNKTSNLSIFANYSLMQNKFSSDKKSLNSKITYNQHLFKNFLILGAVYETSSGNVARQNFVYIKTEPGKGFYTWRDYNNNGVKDLEEFEIAKFQDQATYLRVPLANLHFIATQGAKWQQSLIVNPSIWGHKKGFKKILSHFYSQSFLSVANMQERIGNSFHLNPFNFDKTKLISLQYNLRNTLYFNRGLQKYSFIYTYGMSKNKQQYFAGNQENNTKINQLEYQHKLGKFWLIDFFWSTSNNNLYTENFTNRNYQIKVEKIIPKVSFMYNKNHRLSMLYNATYKENKFRNFEKLQQQTLGIEYFYSSKKGNQISVSTNLIDNKFTGNSNSPVAYQLLEGLQTGKNYTWSFLVNKKINSFLHLNISYLGRKNSASKIIHTGMVELKAFF